MNADCLIELRDIERKYEMGDQVVMALSGVSLEVRPGELVAVVGASGSGKTTLMNIIGCLDTPTAGTYLFEGKPVQKLEDDALSRLRNQKIGFIFQSFHLLPRLTAQKNVELPLLYQGKSSRQRKEQALAALEKVGLGSRALHRPNQMSGGQRQRVAIARALVAEPALLLADEPTGNLDSATARDILQLFHELHSAGNTIIVVTHEPMIAAECPRAIRITDGRIVDDGEGASVARARGMAS